MLPDETRQLAEKIWNYCFIRQPLIRSDAILVLCSHDVRIARHASQLWREGWAPLLLLSGGSSVFTERLFGKPEAEVFAQVAREEGVSPDRILIEDKSTNTGENLLFAERHLLSKGLRLDSFIIVQKPNMLRRAWATARKLWPRRHLVVSSHDIPFSAGAHEHLTEEMLVHEIVGDLQRLALYPSLGYMVSQEIPPDVKIAYEELVRRGFTGNLIG